MPNTFLLILLMLIGVYTPAFAADKVPNIVLWAWQRSEDLSSVNPDEYGIAYMACRVVLAGDTVVASPRTQPLKVPERAKMIPVVRIDTDRKNPPDLSDNQVREVSRIIGKLSTYPKTCALQIDFDALQSEREFYKSLIKSVRSQLPAEIPLSITALASWCLFDNWISDLPVQETVPMMFSLGRDRKKVLLHFQSGRDFLCSGCSKSLGLSLEDTQVNHLMIPLAQSVKYLFEFISLPERRGPVRR